MSVDAVVFDIGNVLIEWQPERFFDREIGRDAREALFSKIDLHAMNDRVDRGENFPSVVYQTAEAHPQMAQHIRLWHDRWLDIAGPEIPQSVETLKDLKAAGVPVYALTNFGVETFEIALPKWPFLNDFDIPFVSGRMKMANPSLHWAGGMAQAFGGRGFAHVKIDVISFDDGERALSWLPLTQAIAEGHRCTIADIKDVFLYRGDDTVLSRAAWIDGIGMAVKTATVFPKNPDHGKPMIGGAVTLFSDADGSLEALIDFRLVTKWKTAGDSLLAALRLAPPKVENILIIGAGTVARSLVDAYGAGFPGATIRVWNRTPDRAEALGIPVVRDLAQAVADADIVTCATMSREPILKGEWLTPGTHVDLIGAYRPDLREADDEVLRRGRLFVDSRATTLEHIGELMIPLASGVIGPEDVLADFTELEAFGRAPDDITVFKNGGGAHLDLMVCRHILSAWRAAQ